MYHPVCRATLRRSLVRASAVAAKAIGVKRAHLVVIRRTDSMKRCLPFCVALAAVTSLPVHVAHAQASVPEACAVISLAEVTTILGRNDLSTPSSEKGAAPGESSCGFSGRVQSGVTDSLSPTTSANFDEFRNMLVELGETPEAVTGVGDAAYFWHPGRVYVLTGRTMITVSFSNETAVNEKMKQDLLALARAVMTNLQG